MDVRDYFGNPKNWGEHGRKQTAWFNDLARQLRQLPEGRIAESTSLSQIAVNTTTFKYTGLTVSFNAQRNRIYRIDVSAQVQLVAPWAGDYIILSLFQNLSELTRVATLTTPSGDGTGNLQMPVYGDHIIIPGWDAGYITMELHARAAKADSITAIDARLRGDLGPATSLRVWDLGMVS